MHNLLWSLSFYQYDDLIVLSEFLVNNEISENEINSLLEEKNQKVLSNILTYHVISGKLAASDVVAALEKGNGSVELTALNGQVITVMKKDGKIWLKDSKGNYSEISATDIMGSNGVIHVINTVVMPE